MRPNLTLLNTSCYIFAAIPSIRTIKSTKSRNTKNTQLETIQHCASFNTGNHSAYHTEGQYKPYDVPELSLNNRILVLEQEIENLNRALLEKDSQIETLRKQNADQQEQMCYTKKQLVVLQQVNDQQVRKVASAKLQSRFTPNQMNLILDIKRKVKWTSEELSQGFTLRYFSLPGYIYLTNELRSPFPKASTLKHYAGMMDMRPGFLDAVLTILKGKSKTMSELERCCVLLYDEMSCRDVLEYDRKHDQVIGPHSKIQVA